MRTTQHAVLTRLQTPKPRELTLLSLIQELCDESDDDREIVATVCQLLRTGRVRLCGNFAGSDSATFCTAGQVAAARSDRLKRPSG